MKTKIIPAVFCLLLMAGIVGSILVPDKYYSENEKRTLKQFPDISLEDVYSGKFGDALEAYLADQFPGRDGWVTVKTIAERFSGKKESGGVYFAKDGYLIETNKSFSQKQTVTNISALKKLSDAMRKEDIPMRITYRILRAIEE